MTAQFKRKSGKHFDVNESENPVYQTLQNEAMQYLYGNLGHLCQTCVIKEESFQVNFLSFHLKKLGKEEKIKKNKKWLRNIIKVREKNQSNLKKRIEKNQ